jgi:hypothetical protein
MSFFNLYNKSVDYSYNKSLKVGSSVFSVGEIILAENSKPAVLIIKLNLNGDVIWEKSYQFKEGNDWLLNAQIAECTNGDILIMSQMYEDSKVTYLARINSATGNVIWEKFIKNAIALIERAIVSIGNENYIIALQDIEFPPSRVVLLKIDMHGNIIAKKMIDHPAGYEFSCFGIAKGNSKVGVYGSFATVVNDNIYEKGLIIEVDFNLTQIITKIVSGQTLGGQGGIQYLIYKGSTFYSFASVNSGVFITKNTVDSSTNILTTPLQKYCYYYLSNIKHNDSHIYLEHNTPEYAEITKINFDLDSVWTKRIGYSAYFYNSRERGILAQATNSETIILAGSGTEVSTPYGHYPIARLDLELNSCKTTDIDKLFITDKSSGFTISDVPYSLIGYAMVFYDYSTPVIRNVSSNKNMICPTIPDSPCIKDADICKIYDTLLYGFNKCILNPEELPENVDFPAIVKCVDKFLDIIYNFDRDYPQYSVFSIFEIQIRHIREFLDNPTLESYQVIWPMLQQLLVHISSLGNCNCEDAIDIDENTWLQSPNFYLQAAGSTGNDSAHGIHLRWTFSGILGEKHMPKGNNATLYVNFNKPNDFVKIHRTRYNKTQFVLDFNLPPQTVNDSQRYWLYKFNNDTRIFFVSFKNAVKYDQVRALNDPFTNPYLFIKNYGNELIEIENKRELFFAAEIEFAHGPTSSLQLESLSVKENTLLTPKFLSFRKSFGPTNLDLPVRVVCENGRVIRFKGNNCPPMKILFEFYSDFIKYTTSKGTWNFLNNYALSTVDPLVEERLDPEPGNPVHGKWLRFNDDAFVNADNYMHKWNGSTEGAFDRNIKDIVTSYISLSNALDNPSAIELLNINLTNQTTPEPDEPPITEDELTEVCNLDILRIISTDYHIARMLGLGTLDAKSNVFEGEYIYLASYTTFGDLGNGPETVQHLSMSLPTTTETQRLPLPVNLHELVPGFVGVSDDADNDYINNNNGYSFDGKKRFISIVTDDLIENMPNPVFYSVYTDIDFSTFTIPVYAGIESRKTLYDETEDDHIWEKPELSNDPDYLNIDSFLESYETIPIIIQEPGTALYVDIQTKSGTYYYATYGINWFSRATSSELELDIKTDLKPYNSLLPPTNVLPYLIRKEFPLMFTSQADQNRFDAISDNDLEPDKTLVRLQFDYNATHELITYQLPESALDDEFFVNDPNSIFPDQYEVMGEHIEIYFRNTLPKKIVAKVKNNGISDESLFLSRIKTEDYFQVSNGEWLHSQLPAGTTFDNFKGSLFLMGNQQYVIHTLEFGSTGLDFIVYKQQLSEGLIDEEIPVLDAQALQSPYFEGDGYFTVVENMQNNTSWGSSNPHSFKVSIGNSDWAIHRELTQSISETGEVEKYIEKTRGFWKDATIHKFYEDYTVGGVLINGHRGIYTIEFNNFQLAHLIQTNPTGNSAEWFNGTVRLYTESNVIGGHIYDSRKTFNVFRAENIGTLNNVKLHISDPDFTLDEQGQPSLTNDIIMDSNGTSIVKVNYYPSYKVYLYHNASYNLTEEQILPAEGEGSRYSIFGLKTVDENNTDSSGVLYKSRFSVPAPMIAQEIIEAKTPDGPLGAKYATRPDFYGKSTYTFTTKYVPNHKPFGVLFYRADNQGFLSAIYDTVRTNEVKSALKKLGGTDELFFTNRWENFLDFNLLGSAALEEENIPGGGNYGLFPFNVPEEEKYRFPLPNKASFFEGINKFIAYHNQRFNPDVNLIDVGDYGTILLNQVIIPAVPNQNDAVKLIDFVSEAIMNVFVPLTEVPMIYKFIKNNTYVPKNKKQRIRDKNGYLIPPPVNVNNPAEITEFDMAPMMKNISPSVSQQTTQFTDFTIEGTSDNVYFYAAKELSSLMKMGAFSPVLGPIKLVNSSPPEAPKVKSLIPVLENRALGINPKMNVEITAYPAIQNIKKINLYRTSDRLEANSVQSMKLIKTIDIDIFNLTNEAIWTIDDNFSDLPQVPYGDTLYYRLTISREIEYAEAIYDNTNEPVIVTEYAPSQPSKIVGTVITENYNPESPVVDYYSEPLINPDTELEFITLHWNETAYKGNYRLYKLNSQGNWTEIARVISDRATAGSYHIFNTHNPTAISAWNEEETIGSIDGRVYIQLETTNINSPNLTVLSEDGTKLYHHFKVIAENTAGMLSKKENILTIYNEVTWTDIGGIAVPDRTKGMIVGPTFRVR